MHCNPIWNHYNDALWFDKYSIHLATLGVLFFWWFAWILDPLFQPWLLMLKCIVLERLLLAKTIVSTFSLACNRKWWVFPLPPPFPLPMLSLPLNFPLIFSWVACLHERKMLLVPKQESLHSPAQTVSIHLLQNGSPWKDSH